MVRVVRMGWGETAGLASSGCRAVAEGVASHRRRATLARVIAWPSRVGSSTESAASCALRCSHARTSLAVVFHSGTDLCLRPLPRR